jgi:hypothetical protein
MSNLAREITLRFTKQNAEMLKKKGLPDGVSIIQC